MSDRLILIPARSGSQRVKNKNLRPIAGKSILQRRIESAKQVPGARVVVSTNDQRIQESARSWGAEAPFLRPDDLSTSTSTSLSVVLHALTFLREAGQAPEWIAFCPPTNPFVRPETIVEMFEVIQASPFDSLVTVAPPKTHPFRIVRIAEDGRLDNEVVRIDSQTINDIERSQDWPKVFEGSPACRMSRAQYFYHLMERKPTGPYQGHESKTYNPKSCGAFEVDSIEALDIDEPIDFEMAEMVIKNHERVKP